MWHALVTAFLVAALAGALAACGGEAEPPRAADSAATEGAFGGTGTRPDPAAGETLRAFVAAAGNADASSMWALLSGRSRDDLGPTEDAFARDWARDFAQGLGTFAGTGFRVVVSAEVPSGWGVAAIAGERTRRGEKEFAAYGVALRREDGDWRIVLGDPVEITLTEPEGTETAERRPRIAVDLRAPVPLEEAGVWLDGELLPAQAEAGSIPDLLHVEGRPATPLAPGWHVVVVFGRAGEVAAAGAIPLSVDPSEDAGPVA